MDRRLPPAFLQQVQESTDIVEIVSRSVALKKSGQNYLGLCPFHAEKTPSFTVSASKQLFYCFGCGAGGSAFTFLMKTEGMSFPEAVRHLGRQAGLELPESAPAHRESDRRQRLRVLLDQAAVRFHRQLLAQPESDRARAYLTERQVSEATIDVFGIGYAPPGWDGLLTAMTRQGWTAQELLEVGLIVRRQDGSGYYDRFRDRIIFPIRDLQGHTVGFGARVLDESLPKYLNSPETALYSKGRVLYGLDRARAAASKTGSLVVVEGYFDAIAAHQAGVGHVVATLGTALTASHLQLLQRLVSRVVLLFDPDPAGVRATLRTMDLFLEHGLQALVATLPEGVDPDNFIRQYGVAAFEERLAAAQPLLEYAIERTLACTPHEELDGKLAVVRALMPTLRNIRSRLELDHYLQVLAQRLGVAESSLRADLAASAPPAARGRVAAVPAPQTPSSVSSGSLAAWSGEERVLLHLWVHRRVETAELVGRLQPEELAHPVAQALVRMIGAVAEQGERDPVQSVIARAAADETLAGAIANLSLMDIEYDSASRAFEECLARLQRRQLDRRIQQLEEARRQAEGEGNEQRARELQVAILQSQRGGQSPPSREPSQAPAKG